MQYGIINIPVADIRSHPEMQSERLSQVLFGTAIEIRTTKNKYSKIELPEGYIGWCYAAHINHVESGVWKKYKSRKKQPVRLLSVNVYDQSGIKQHPYNLYFGTELVIQNKNGVGVYNLPGMKTGYFSASSLKTIPNKKHQDVKPSQIISCARKFLGSPYLWGGITSSGLDCSGLVQLIYRFYGIELPRDSKNQRMCGEEIRDKNIQYGDLLFFPRHVGISLGKGQLIHASAYRGMVTIDSMNKLDENYRPDLVRDFEFARRIRLCE